MLKAIIVDDEPQSRKTLAHMVKAYCAGVEVVATAFDVLSAVKEINVHQPDIVFLDIEMPNYSGFKLIECFEKINFDIIFTTAYEQYAIQAFDTFSVDYLVKPFRLERFKRAIDKLLKFGINNTMLDIQKLEQIIHPQKKAITSFSLPIKLGGRILLIDYEDITHLKAEEKYIRVFTKNGKSYLSDSSLGKLSERLPDYFIRVHRSAIINRNFIKEVRKFFKGKLILVLNDRKETAITTGETYSSKVRKLLGF